MTLLAWKHKKCILVNVIMYSLVQTRKLLLNETIIIHADHGNDWIVTKEKAIETINQD